MGLNSFLGVESQDREEEIPLYHLNLEMKGVSTTWKCQIYLSFLFWHFWYKSHAYLFFGGMG